MAVKIVQRRPMHVVFSDLVHALVEHSGVGVPGLAVDLGLGVPSRDGAPAPKSAAWLYHRMNGRAGIELELWVGAIQRLQRMRGVPSSAWMPAAEALAESMGGSFLPCAAAANVDADVRDAALDTQLEFDDVLRMVRKALADGTIDEAERQELQREIQEAVASIHTLQRCVEND